MEKGRKLPGWMLKKSSTEAAEEEQRPLLEFNGHIDYCSTLGECGSVCEELILKADEVEELIVGFDLEWPVSYKVGTSEKTAVIQICAKEDTCHLFHVSCMKNLPKIFVNFLEHPKIKFVGLNIVSDFWKLCRDFDISVMSIVEKNVIDIGQFANTVLNCGQNWSLDRLVLHLKRMNKSDDIRKGNWSTFPLDHTQQIYAATDAYEYRRKKCEQKTLLEKNVTSTKVPVVVTVPSSACSSTFTPATSLPVHSVMTILTTRSPVLSATTVPTMPSPVCCCCTITPFIRTPKQIQVSPRYHS